jgi:hypothetical protein
MRPPLSVSGADDPMTVVLEVKLTSPPILADVDGVLYPQDNAP